MAAVRYLRPCPLLAKAALLSFAVCAAVSVSGQAGAPTSSPSDSNSYAVAGTVINSVTGDPIRRALVQAGDKMALTDPEGRFELRGLPAGQATVDATKPGFFTAAQLSNGVAPFRLVSVGPHTPDIVVKLIPEGVIFGRISDEDGDPMENITVRASGWRIIEGRRVPEQFGYQRTDEDGRYRLFNLTPGTYYVVASPMGQNAGVARRIFRSGEAGYPTAYFPGVTQLTAATPLKIGAGQQMQADFALRRQPMFQVSGWVAENSGAQVNMVQLVDPFRPGDTVPASFDHQTAAFIARAVPPGSYVLAVQALDKAGHELYGEAAVNVTTDVAGVVVALAPPISIPVLVQTEFTSDTMAGGGGRAASVAVHLRAAELSFIRPDLWSRPEGGKISQNSVVSSVRPGRYYVEAATPSNCYVQSLVSGSTDLLQDLLSVGPGGAVEPIQVVLRDDGASLRGVVRSGDAAVPGAVLAVMEDEPLRLPRISLTSAQGEFQFDNLPPGNYVVLAFDSVADLEYGNRAALRDYVSRGTRVLLGSKDAKAVSVELIHR